jgi:hypothetical protein
MIFIVTDLYAMTATARLAAVVGVVTMIVLRSVVTVSLVFGWLR